MKWLKLFEDWDFDFTGGPSNGKKLSDMEISTIDIYDDNIYDVYFVNDSRISLKTSELLGLLSVTNNDIKLAVIKDSDDRKWQKTKRRIQKLAVNRIIVLNPDRRDGRLYPYLLVSDSSGYEIASEFEGKLDTPRKVMIKKIVQDSITDGTFVKNIKDGVITIDHVINTIQKVGMEVPKEILDLR
jgi:hypothetical protein